MKNKIFVIIFLWGFFISTTFSQNEKYAGGGRFSKRVEFNMLASHNVYNFEGKSNLEKLFFGDFNAPVEFFYAPSFEGASGFRVVMDSLNASWILEIKRILNYDEAIEEAKKEAADERHRIDIPINLLDTLPRDVFNLVFDFNGNIRSKKYYEELLKRYKIETRPFSISKQFAEKLYQKMVLLIGNFKAKGSPPVIFDGYEVTFRTVVDEEVWSLNIHMPKDDTLKMVDLCKQIITDARTGKYDEPAYISVLNAF